jgi:hypothetical protein
MARERNHSELMGRMIGEGGDYYIGTDPVSDKKFSLIQIGAEGATVAGAQIGNQDVRTLKNYPAKLPGGYLMCAGGDNHFNHIHLTDGYAEGVLMSEEE